MCAKLVDPGNGARQKQVEPVGVGVAGVVFTTANLPHHSALSHLAEFLYCVPCLPVLRMPQRGEDLALITVLGMMPSCLPLGP